jgi:xanthine phosphoribosyltransferase
MLAHKLKVREIDTIDIRSYDDTHEQQQLVVHRTCDVDYLIRRGKGLIVVDDLIDSGNTIREAKQLLPEAHIAVVYVKPKGEELADFYARRVPQKTWIEFPYE